MSKDITVDRDEIPADFQRLEHQLQEQHPGVFDLMQAYGVYDAAAKVAEQYLNVIGPSGRTVFFTADNSTAPR